MTGPGLRARALGIAPGRLPTGAHNAITDVPGVLVGQVTLRDRAVATGVTAIRPHPGNLFQDKVAAGVFVGNGFGKLAGSTQVRELGTIETPIVLTNTLAVGTALNATIDWTLDLPGNETVTSINAIVGETNDGVLNDIRARPVREEHVLTAIRDARDGPVAEGSVGAGTGTICFGWKGGIGTCSRVLPDGRTVGVLVQTNFGGSLRIDGMPLPGPEEVANPTGPTETDPSPDGSCMIVVATDAPLGGRDLERVAARAVFAMARTGSIFSNGSGDYGIAFSTNGFDATNPSSSADPTALFAATMDATEEAIYNSLLMATTVTGHLGRRALALPLDLLRRSR